MTVEPTPFPPADRWSRRWPGICDGKQPSATEQSLLTDAGDRKVVLATSPPPVWPRQEALGAAHALARVCSVSAEHLRRVQPRGL
jgi:hypothetical protein